MTDYGVQPTGYVRKPIAVILAELEAAMITEFGPGVIQTPQSPFGQLNGLMADLVAEVEERNLDLYQSYDPDQAEGVRLDTLARLRLINRNLENDASLRKSITNEGQSRVDIQDLSRAVKDLDGVTYAQVFVNESGEVTNYGLDRGSIALAVIGGDDSEIAETMRRYVVPGVNSYGNQSVTSNINGFCRSMNIIRPIQVEVTLTLQIKLNSDRFGCPPPSTQAVKSYLVKTWQENVINGQDPSFFTIRSIVESEFSNVEVVTVTAERDSITNTANQPLLIGFIEMAELDEERTTITVIE